MEIRKEIGIIATALKQSKNAVIRYFGSGNRILYNQWKLVVTIRELEREQWNSRFTKYGFEGN